MWNDALAFLRANDISVRSADVASGEIDAYRDNFQDAGWAYCEPALVTDHASDTRRQRRTQVFLDRSLMLRVDLRTVGDAVLVAPDASFTERQVNSFKNLPIDVVLPLDGCPREGAARCDRRAKRNPVHSLSRSRRHELKTCRQGLGFAK